MPSRILVGALLLCGLLVMSTRAGDTASQTFPLSQGTFWVYHGLVRSQEEGSTIGKVTDVTWKMSVVRTFDRDGVFIAVVSGFPGDLNWSDGRAEPQLSALIRTQDSKFFLDSLSDADVTLEKLGDPSFALTALVDKAEWILQLPIADGKKFSCDPGASERDDGQYCWIAGPPHPAALEGVKGVTSGNRTAYNVQYLTLPDDTEFEFVPSVGITNYEYHHHGTIAETELHLVEFHAPAD
jgi:hypothetical protein